MTLAPWSVRPRPTSWVAPEPLPALLEHALADRAERVYLTGPRQPLGWLYVPTPGWTPGTHYVDTHGLDVGRFTHDATGRSVVIARAASWFGEGDYTNREAAEAHALLQWHYGRAFTWGGEPARLLDSPAATGLDAWVRTIPDVRTPPAQLGDELAALVRRTSPQHRVEMFRYGAPELPGFHYLDGRLMYASLTRELGTGPATVLEGDAAQAFALANPHARARYLVQFEVPRDWPTLGLFMVPRERGDCARCCPRTVRVDTLEDAREWHAPHTPGWRGVAWCDAAELRIALLHEWPVHVLRALVFSKGRPLDVWTSRLVKLREKLDTVLDDEAGPLVRDMARAAVRSILLYAIGAFHSTGRRVTMVSTNPREAPPTAQQHGDVYVWHTHAELTGRNAQLAHPEWSSQVWGRAHARVLEAPVGRDALGVAGALAVAPTELLGIRGDAVYTTYAPGWPDDGRVGRLRSKGSLAGPIKAPTSWTGLNKLRARAERARKEGTA